jgi:hypothetical protein
MMSYGNEELQSASQVKDGVIPQPQNSPNPSTGSKGIQGAEKDFVNTFPLEAVFQRECRGAKSLCRGSGTGIFGAVGLDAAGCNGGSALGWLDNRRNGLTCPCGYYGNF